MAYIVMDLEAELKQEPIVMAYIIMALEAELKQENPLAQPAEKKM